MHTAQQTKEQVFKKASILVKLANKNISRVVNLTNKRVSRIVNITKKRTIKFLDKNDEVADFVENHPKFSSWAAKKDPNLALLVTVAPIISKLRKKFDPQTKIKDKQLAITKYNQVSQEI